MSRHRQRVASYPVAKRGRATAASPSRRLAAIDAARGLAICLMIVYHVSYDLSLNWIDVIRTDFNRDPFWLGFRGVIVSAFLLLVGVSLVLAHRAGQRPRHFWRRIALIAACAGLISGGSYVAFPRTFIFFGILHLIAVASILARPLVPYPWIALALGVAIVAVGNTVALPWFDAWWTQWIGLMTHKPVTEDYVPLFPWLGVVLIGVAAGVWLATRDFGALRPLGRAAPKWLAWLGRYSLLIYMVHQPLLLAALWVVFGR